MPYRFPINAGDRVALAPHLDLWMAGIRYGDVGKITRSHKTGERIYRVDYGAGRFTWLSGDDLLGAI